MPIVVAWRTAKDEVGWGIGAGMIVNDDGWFITAGHILQQIANLEKQVSAYDPSRSKKRNQTTATHYVSIFGGTKAHLGKALLEDKVDLGVGKLENFIAPKDHVFPRLRVREVEQGELLCRVGFPFVDTIRLQWTKGNGFTFTNLFPVPLFVNEALVSRFMAVPESGIWIETSSPGLKGQSGGPLVDSDGLICGIQVNTVHYPLGFEGTGRNQVLNVGRAVHIDTVRGFLDNHGIKHCTEGT